MLVVGSLMAACAIWSVKMIKEEELLAGAIDLQATGYVTCTYSSSSHRFRMFFSRSRRPYSEYLARLLLKDRFLPPLLTR